MASTIGTAYVQILPSAKGITGKVKSELDGPMSEAGGTAGSKIASGMKRVIAAAAIGKAVAASLNEGAKLEQSLGGIETLFKNNADRVKKYATQSYKTTGLSANEYMENVTSFSASLISSLGGNTKKAADLSNTAMKDMSDNANKMGTDMEMITQTYQSLARGNYAMLDNLKLGYGGTKSEMKRLMKDAEKLTGEHYTVGDFGDTVKAIHAIQNNLGITGTTAKEAAHTMSGSFNSLKAAWKDLLGNLALGKDVEPQIKNLIDSAVAMIKNYAPAIKNVIKGIWDQIPMPGKILLGFIGLRKGVISAVSGIRTASDTVKTIGNGVSSAKKHFVAFRMAASGMQGPMVQGSGVAAKLGNAFRMLGAKARAAGVAVMGAMKKMAVTAGGALRGLATAARTAGAAIVGAMKRMALAVGAALKAIGRALLANPWMIAIAAAVAAVILIIKNWDKVKAFLIKLWNGIKSVAGNVWNAIKNAIMVPVNAVKGALQAIWNGIKTVVVGYWRFIFNAARLIWGTIGRVILAAVNGVRNVVAKVWGGMKGIASRAWGGIKNVASTIWGGIKGTVGKAGAGMLNNAKTTLSAMKKSYQKNGGGIKGTVAALCTFQKRRFQTMYNALNALTGGRLGKMLGTVRSKFASIKSAMTKPVETAKNAIKRVIDKIKGIFRSLKLRIPKPHIPNISVDWKTIGSGKLKIKIPKISWNAKGGIFTKPTLLGNNQGVGEAGPEAVLPLKLLWDRFDSMADSIVNGVGTRIVAGNQSGDIHISLYAFPSGPKMEEWVVDTYNKGTKKGLK